MTKLHHLQHAQRTAAAQRLSLRLDPPRKLNAKQLAAKAEQKLDSLERFLDEIDAMALCASIADQASREYEMRVNSTPGSLPDVAKALRHLDPLKGRDWDHTAATLLRLIAERTNSAYTPLLRLREEALYILNRPYADPERGEGEDNAA